MLHIFVLSSTVHQGSVKTFVLLRHSVGLPHNAVTLRATLLLAQNGHCIGVVKGLVPPSF